MRKAYESKPEDINPIKDDDRQKDKLVVIRKVSNPFWLVREVLRYGKNCEIVSPEAVRQKMIKEIEKMNELYS